MAGQTRTTQRAVELCEQLARAPQKFDFFAALRWIECAQPDKPRLGTSLRATEDPVRLGQEPSLAFAPSALHSYGPTPKGRAPRLAVNFFGLLGPNGPLPLHITEFVRARARDRRDRTLGAFFDVFHHRLLSLFYRAWMSSSPTAQFDRPESDRFATYVGALVGRGTPATAERGALDGRVLRHYAGRFAAHGRTAEGLRDVLSDYFGVDVEVVEFVGQWLPIPERDHTRLGDPDTAVLGESTCLGTAAYTCQQKFRLVVGPLDYADYARLLPDAPGAQRLSELVRSYVGDEFSWESQLVLRRDQVPEWRLETEDGPSCGAKLGWTTWLAGDVDHDPDELVAVGSREPEPAL